MRRTNSIRDFEIQTDPLISPGQPNLVIINNKRELVKLYALLSRLTTVKLNENEKKDKYLDLVRELKKLWNMKVMMIIGALGTVAGGLRNKRPSGDHPNYTIIKIG